jgi:hypothetical protein
MKINEITNAEDMLALWKLISDNTWLAEQQQAEQQAREKAERAAKTKSTKGAKKGGGRKPPAIAVPKPHALITAPQVMTATIAPANQDVLWHQRERGQDANLDRGLHLRADCNCQETPASAQQSS